jgi:prepilin-type N-terminal cleavage/methylation domain-containing protein
MTKLFGKLEALKSNKKKGFTLTELIIVIVIIAILIAALTPAILGVINRANRSADEADLRMIMMAGSVAASLTAGNTLPDAAQVRTQLTGTVADGRYSLYFDASGSIVVSGRIANGGRLRANAGADRVVIGDITDATLQRVDVTMPVGFVDVP